MSASPRTAFHSQNAAVVVFAALSLLVLFSPGAGAATLEQVYQRALEDPEFKTADEELNAAYSRGMRTLPKEERDKLRQAERFWIRENQDLLLQNPQREVEVLKQRFLKRRDELLRLKTNAEAPAPPTAAAAQVPSTAPAGTAGVWTEKAAANLEKVYQAALQDPEFETADSSLRALFKEAVSVLPPGDREKLKSAQKAWVRENAVLVAADPARGRSILAERVVQRRSEILHMLGQRRFEPTAAAPPPATPSEPTPVSAQPPTSLPEPVLKEPALPPPAPVPTAPAAAEPREPALSVPGNQIGAGLPRVFWALLGTWVLGFGFFHYRAFAQKPKAATSNPPPPLNVRGLYLATGTGFLVSLLPLLAAPSALTAILGVLFSIVGLGTAKIAAEESARRAGTPGVKQAEAPRQQVAVEQAVGPATGGAALVQAELQPPVRGNNRKGNRQKRRRQ